MKKGDIVFSGSYKRVGTVVNVLTDGKRNWCDVRFAGNSKYNLRFIEETELVKCDENAILDEIRLMIGTMLNAIKESTNSEEVDSLVIRLHTEIDFVFEEFGIEYDY